MSEKHKLLRTQERYSWTPQSLPRARTVDSGCSVLNGASLLYSHHGFVVERKVLVVMETTPEISCGFWTFQQSR